MTAGASDRERFARIALSFVAEPGDPVLGALLRACGAAEAFAAICDGRLQQPAGASVGGCIPRLGRAIERWAARLGEVPTESRLAAWERAGIRVLCPGDPGWPTQLDVLGDVRPLMLWLRGSADLRFACLRSILIVGARAATGYGQHVATEMAAALAERGFCVVSGGPNSTKAQHRAPWLTWTALGLSGLVAVAALPDGPGDFEAAQRCGLAVSVAGLAGNDEVFLVR